MYLHIPENCDFFAFGNRLGLVFIPRTSLGLQYCNAGTPSNGCIQLPYCASLDSQFCKFGTARYDMIYCFFVLVAYPAQWTGAVLHNPCKIRLGREAMVLGCNYQSLCLSFQSRASEQLVGFIIVNICSPYSFGLSSV